MACSNKCGIWAYLNCFSWHTAKNVLMVCLCAKALHIFSDYGTCGVQAYLRCSSYLCKIKKILFCILKVLAWSALKCHSTCFLKSVQYVVLFSGIPRNFVWGGGSTNSVEDRTGRQGSGGGSLLVRGSGGSCNFAQQISFHIVKSY